MPNRGLVDLLTKEALNFFSRAVIISELTNGLLEKNRGQQTCGGHIKGIKLYRQLMKNPAIQALPSTVLIRKKSGVQLS